MVSDVTCRHSNGTEYGLNVCLEQLSQMPSLVEPCYVACPSECQLSEWEPWGRCVQGCEGKRFRWRKLLGVYIYSVVWGACWRIYIYIYMLEDICCVVSVSGGSFSVYI